MHDALRGSAGSTTVGRVVPSKVRFLAALLAGCALAGCSDICVYQGACVDPEHFSLEPTPLQIDLKVGNPKLAHNDHASLRIPRSYVVFANHHSSRKGALPQQFVTDHIEIRFLEDGEAWNVAFDRESRRSAGSLAKEKLRPLEYRVALRANANPNARTDRQANIAGSGHVRQRDRYEGLIHYSGGNELFVGDASDAFESISCFGQLNPAWFCTYHIDVSETMSVSATFLDFRLHGGRAYANRRAQLVREVVCGFIACEPDEVRREQVAARPFIGDQKRRVCILRETPHKVVAMGLAANVRSTQSPAVTHQTFWRLRVPAYFGVQDAWPRTDVASTLSAALLYPEMVPATLVEEELRRAWLTVPVSDQERRGFSVAPTDTPCLAYAELSLEDLAERTVHVVLRAPADYPQAADFVPGLRCTLPGASPHLCFLGFLRDGWHVDVSFRLRWRNDGEKIRDRVDSYLDQITLSRDPVPVVAAAPREGAGAQ